MDKSEIVFEKEYHKRSFARAFKEQDLYYTPSILVKCLVPYLKYWEGCFILEHKRNPIIWLPFDDENSKYVEILQKEGFEIVRSHINEDKDFFKYEPEQWDIAVSNPPFSRKLDIFKRHINDFGNKPFIYLMNMMAVNYQIIGELFQSVNPDIQFIIPDKKVSFDGNTSSFCSGYVCYKFIKQTEFLHLENNNTGENFRK